MKTMKLLFAAVAAVMMTGSALAEKAAKAVLENSGKTLRFVYDMNDYGTKGTDWFSVAEAEAIDPVKQNVPWYGVASQITNVVFDASFKAYRPEQCALWLYFFSNLKAVDGMENLDTSKVKSMYRMFTGDWDLLSLDLSALDTGSVTNMFQMFMNCMSITTIYASELFVTSQVGNSVNMFMDCSALIGGEGTKYDSTKIDKAYARIDGKDGQPGYFTYKPPAPTAKAVLEDSGKTLRFVYDDKNYGTKGTDWFSVADAEAIVNPLSQLAPWHCVRDAVTKAIVDASFAAYRPTQCVSWFYGFTNLTTITELTNLDTSRAVSMHNMFRDCEKLETLDLSNFNTANVTNMKYMFKACVKVTSLDVTGFDTSKVTDMCGMFEACHKVTTLDVTGFDTSKVTDMHGMFYNCGMLQSLDLSGFDTSKVTRMTQMFDFCYKLKTIFVSETFVTTNVTSSLRMFYECSSLVGGKGSLVPKSPTESEINVTCARIDGGPDAPGYFTYKAAVPDGSFAIHFVANGGTGTMSDQVCERGKVFKLTKNKFAKSGKTFKGWTCSNGKRYDDGVLVFDLAESGKAVTMTAIWE